MRIDLHLAALADVDPRSARRALKEGIAAVRGRAGEKIAEAARLHGIALPQDGAYSAAHPAST